MVEKILLTRFVTAVVVTILVKNQMVKKNSHDTLQSPQTATTFRSLVQDGGIQLVAGNRIKATVRIKVKRILNHLS